MDTKQKPPKEKRRNNEKRKEKSRDAARCRRSRETEIFTDLSNALPLSQDQVSQLDKASVMRLAISYLRVRDMIKLVPEVKCTEKIEELSETDESAFLKSMDGFLLVVSMEGDFVFVSENVSDYLGISQIDLMGQNVYEYSHPCDHDEIKDILSRRSQQKSDLPKSFFLRLKCTLTSKGRSVNLKSATYKVIHCTGHMLQEVEDKKDANSSCLIAIGQPIPHPSNIEAPLLPSQTFLTKHSLDMKFTYADEKMNEFLGYNSDDLLGKSVYEYHHATDTDSIAGSYKCLFSKGQCETNRYRFLAKTGGYVWVLTQATLIYDKVLKPQSVVCVNYVISGIECKDEIYSAFQLLSSVKTESVAAATVSDVVEEIVDDNNLSQVEEIADKPLVVTAKLFVDDNLSAPTARPQTATSKIFAPRTEEMSKGFLTFSDEEPGLTLLKDEPDDLTHLAPVAGEMVPLEGPFLSDMLDDFLLRDGFCPLLTDEPSDPFISYRDSCDPSPQLLSPNILKNSDCSLPSLNSPTDSLGEEDRLSFLGLRMEEDPELVMKAPYIPMSIENDLPLLNPDDLMWGSSDRNNSDDTPDNSSSLAQLLSSSVNKHSLKSSDHGGTLLQANIDGFYDKSSVTHGTTYSKLPKLKSISDHSNWNLSSQKNASSKEHQSNNKRTNGTAYDASNKRVKCEPKDNMSSELLQQLMSNNHNRGRSKGKSNWLLDSGGRKAACISQPSDSVLMNLLDDPSEAKKAEDKQKILQMLIANSQKRAQEERSEHIRRNSISLLNPESIGIPSLFDLTQQDYEVNAPTNCFLQGKDLINALEISEGI